MRIAVLIVGLLVVVLGVISLVGTGFSVPRLGSEVDVQVFEMDPGDQLTVRGTNGRVTYEKWDGDGVKIEATKEVRGLTPGLAERIKEWVSVEITQNENGVHALSRRVPGAWLFGNVTVHFHILTPAEWWGDLSVTTANGAINVDGHSGSLQVRTSNGRIDLHNVQSSVDAQTSNGPIRVFGATLERSGRVRTSNGTIQVEARLSEDASYDVRTSNGRVTVGLAEPNVSLDLTTSNGRIDLQTDVTVSKIDRRNVVGRIGEGEAQLNVRTSNGSITIWEQSE